MAEDKTSELEFFTGKPFDQKAAASKGRPAPAKDFFTGTDFSTVPESYSTKRQLQDGLFINEITRPIKGNVEDYTKYGVPLYRGFDWDEIRARNQGTVEKWVNGIAKAGVVTATSFTENLLGVPMGIISMASGGDFFDNSLGRRVDKVNDWMQENMPNYKTRQEENNSVLAGLGTANFWADTFLNGLGYSIGSIASVYATGGVGVIGMTSKLGSAAARGMGVYKAAKAIATGTKLANTLQKGAKVGTSVLNAAKVADMGFMMALAESSVESRETKNRMREMLQEEYMEEEGLVNISEIPPDVLSDIEDASSAAGNTNFVANLAIVGGTNMFMFGKMALGFNGATKKLSNVVYDRALGKFVNTMPNQSVRRAAFEKAALLSKNSLGELLQEGGQYASNIYATEVHGEKFHDGGSVDRMQALNKAFTDTFGDKEGRESMLVGALVGLFMGGRGAFGPTQTQKDNGKREALVKILNSGAFNGISRQMQEENVQSATIKKMELAAQQGDIETFKDLQAKLIQNHAFSLIERGGYGVYMEMLEDSKALSDADFMDRFGFPKENENGVPYTIEEHLQGKTKSQFIDGVKEKVEHVNKIHKNVNDMFPLPNQTQGLPRVLMGEEGRAAEDRAFNRAYNLRRELAGYGYGLYDRSRRRSQIVENIQKEIDNNPILKALNINVDSGLAKIKQLESEDIADMSNSFQTLADKEVEKAKVFDDVMSKINTVAQSPKIEEMINDYLSLGLKDVSAIDAYNKLASDPNYRKMFNEELERNEASQKDSALDKKVEEVILGAKTSEELETQRPAADTMTDSQIEALRERKAELIKEEDTAKRKYLKRVENKTEEDALEDLKAIDRENLSPTDIVGLRSAIAVMQGKVDSIKSNSEKGADAARNIFKGPQPQGDPNLTPEALGGVEKVSEDGRHFVINGKKYYNDKPNIEDAIKTPSKVTLRSENGNPATFTNKLTVQGITLAIKAAVARRESTSQPDINKIVNTFNTPTGAKLIQQIDLFGDAVKYWTDQVVEAVKNKEIAPLPQRDYNIVRKEILDLVATLEAGNRLNDALSARRESNNFSKSVIEKALDRLNTLINTRINTLEKVLQPAEATVEDITNLIEELTQQLETLKATDNNTSNATASKALTKYLTELIRFKIETLKNKLDDSSETDEDTESPGPTPPTTPGPDAGQTGTGKATDPGTTSESQEFPVVTGETQNLPDEPTSNVFDEPGQGVPATNNTSEKESIDPVEPGQIDNSTRPPLFDEHGNIQITEESQELPDEPTEDVFGTPEQSSVEEKVRKRYSTPYQQNRDNSGLVKVNVETEVDDNIIEVTFTTIIKNKKGQDRLQGEKKYTTAQEFINEFKITKDLLNNYQVPVSKELGEDLIKEYGQEKLKLKRSVNSKSEDRGYTMPLSAYLQLQEGTPAGVIQVNKVIIDTETGEVLIKFLGFHGYLHLEVKGQRTAQKDAEQQAIDDFDFGMNSIQEDVSNQVAKIKKYDVFIAPDGNTGFIGKGVKENGSVPLLDGGGSTIGYYKFNDLKLQKELSEPTQQVSDVKQSDIDDLLSKEKTIKIGRYTPSSKFSSRVSGELLFLEVIDALNSIVSFSRTISSKQIKQIDEVLDLFAPVLSIKTIDQIIAKYEDEDANFFEVLDALNKLKQRELEALNAMQGYAETGQKPAQQPSQPQGSLQRNFVELENLITDFDAEGQALFNNPNPTVEDYNTVVANYEYDLSAEIPDSLRKDIESKLRDVKNSFTVVQAAQKASGAEEFAVNEIKDKKDQIKSLSNRIERINKALKQENYTDRQKLINKRDNLIEEKIELELDIVEIEKDLETKGRNKLNKIIKDKKDLRKKGIESHVGRVEATRTGVNANTVIDTILNNDTLSIRQKELLKIIKEYLPKGVTFDFSNTLKSSGSISSSNKTGKVGFTIEISTKADSVNNIDETILHELTHMLTVEGLRTNAVFRKEILELYNIAKKNTKEDFYGLKNEKEFLAEAFTNPEFQEYLESIDYKNTTLWNRFKQAVLNLLGLKKGNLLLETLNRTLKYIDSNFDRNQQTQQTQQQGVQIMYTPKGKARQTYTIVGTKILNANGKEVYKKDSADRRKIFANLAIQQKRARVVEYKGDKYIVNNKNQIMSVATGKIMQWGENDGNRKAILDLLKPITPTVSTNQSAATPPEATHTPKPGGMQLMNDASFKTRDSSGRYYVAVNPDGTPDLMAALMPDGVTSYGPVTLYEEDEISSNEKVLIPNTGLLVSSSSGESVTFVLARELWFNDTLENYEEFFKENVLNQRFEDVPIHVYKDGSFVGRLESANPTNRLERKEIVRRLAKGETVSAPINKIVGTNPNYARSTEDEQGYFSDPRQVIAGDVNIAAVSFDRGVMSLESGVESINEDFLEIASSINFSNLLPGSVVFKVNPSQTPNNEVNFVKGFTRNLDGAAINAVNKMLSDGNMESVKEVVANSPASDSQSDTYLNIDKFGQTGQNFMVFKSPSLGRMVRVSSEEMLKAMRSNGVAKVGLVAFSDETDQFQTDKSAKVPKGYNVRKDFQNFIQSKKFQVDVEKANNNAPFYNPAELENGSPKYYESYQEYLFDDRYEGMNGHNSILSLDVVEVNGSIYHDLGVAFDRLSTSGEASEKVVAAVNNIKPAQVSGKIQALRANRNLNNRRNSNIQKDIDDFGCV